jgi:hypothetical protein
MFRSDVGTLIWKDMLLLWRDRSFVFVLLLWLVPFSGLIKHADVPSFRDTTRPLIIAPSRAPMATSGQESARRSRLTFQTNSPKFTSLSKLEQQWLLSRIEVEHVQREDAKLNVNQKIWGIGGALILAATLVSTMVMLTTVEENSTHTLPLLLVCAVDRKTIFSAKLILAMFASVGGILTAVLRTWRAMPATVDDAYRALGSFIVLIAGVLFVFIGSVLHITNGCRSRNNLEALAKLGAPMILMGFLILLVITPLADMTPGIAFVPLTNSVLLAQQIISGDPNWLICAVALGSSAFFVGLLWSSCSRAFRCEQGLTGDVKGSDPKVDSLMMFLAAAALLILLYNFVALPCYIVYPGIADLVASALLLTVGATVLRLSKMPKERILGEPKLPEKRFLVYCLLVLPVFFTPFDRAFRAIAEELVLRGVLVGTLADEFNPWVLALMMAALGAALHPVASAWLPMAAVSFVLTMVRLKTGSVLPCIPLHVLAVSFVNQLP